MTPESPCLRLADGYEQCGLLWQHPGPCVPFTPGDYLPPPVLHPLDLLLAGATFRCPLCGTTAGWIDGELVTPIRGVVLDWGQVKPEFQLTFHPCGCVGREPDFTKKEELRMHDLVVWLWGRNAGRVRAA